MSVFNLSYRIGLSLIDIHTVGIDYHNGH